MALTLVAAVPPVRAQSVQALPRSTATEVDSLRRAHAGAPRDLATALALARGLAALDRIESRREAVGVLQTARRWHPRSLEVRIVLADLYDRQGFFTKARRELRAALALSPDGGAPAYARLGRMAMRDWVRHQHPEGMRIARRWFEESLRTDRYDTESWLGLGVLALFEEQGAIAERHARACLAAYAAYAARGGGAGRPAPGPGLVPQGPPGATTERAAAGRDPRGEALLLLGAAAYIQGHAQQADSAFRAALPRLQTSARAHLTDITPAASDEDTAAFQAVSHDSRAREEFLRRFWQARDPDLTTAINELELEFLSRGTLAYFLFFDQRRQRWDERGALLVRYGKPEAVQENPVTLGTLPITHNVVLWSYPSLGMEILLEDRYLSGAYDLPISLYDDVDPRPAPERVALGERSGALAAAGRGLFRARGRDTPPLPGEARVALFRRVEGFDPRLGSARSAASAGRAEVYVSTIAGEAPVEVEAVAFDSTWREVARGASRAVVGCSSDSARVAQVAFDLPPGSYTIGVSARARRAAGAKEDRAPPSSHWKLPLAVAPLLPGRLEVSDLEIACDLLPEASGGPFDKFAFAVVPNPGHRVRRDQPLRVYFEVYGLVPDEAGRSRLEMEYSVRTIAEDGRPFFLKWFDRKSRTPRVQVTREDETPGRARFQFVSADLENPDPGPYRLDVQVTDLQSGQVAARSVSFEVEP
jgi:GWxTD domain-containing protein